MSTGFISGLSASRNGVPAFGWMVVIALVGFVYYNYLHKKSGYGNNEDKGIHKILKTYVLPITIIVVLGTLLIGNFELSGGAKESTPTNTTTISYTSSTTSDAGML